MNEEEQIFISAVRYALGRMSYIVGVTVEFMISKSLSQKCKDVMIRDIEEAIKNENTGMYFDQIEWIKLLEHLKSNPHA